MLLACLIALIVDTMVDCIADTVAIVTRSNIFYWKVLVLVLKDLLSRLQDAVFYLKEFHFLFPLDTVGITAILPWDLSHLLQIFLSIKSL